VNNELETVVIYDYDAAGRIIKAHWTYYEWLEQPNTVINFSYDERSRLAQRATDEDGDGNIDVISRFDYRTPNLVIRSDVYPPARDVRLTRYFYDDVGRRTRIEWWNGSVEVTAYDRDGRERNRTSTDAKGSVYSRAREELDAKRRILRGFAFDAKNAVWKMYVENQYRTSGQLESEVKPPDSVKTYQYGSQGVLQSSESTFAGKKTLRTVYSYRGTWKAERCGEVPDFP
jgi:hypothetical protein